MDEKKIKEVLSEVNKSDVPDTWDKIEKNISNGSGQSKNVRSRRSRRFITGGIAIAAAFCLIFGGIGIYDGFINSDVSKGGADKERGFVLEAYADTGEESTKITKGEEGTISLTGSSLTMGYVTEGEDFQSSMEYVVLLKAGGKDYKEYAIKSVENGSEISVDGTPDANGRSVHVSGSNYSVEIDSPVSEDENGETVYSASVIVNADEDDDFGEEGDGNSDVFAISSDGSKVVTVIIEVTYTDGETEEFTLTLTPKENTENVVELGSSEGETSKIKLIEYDIALD